MKPRTPKHPLRPGNSLCFPSQYAKTPPPKISWWTVIASGDRASFSAAVVREFPRMRISSFGRMNPNSLIIGFGSVTTARPDSARRESEVDPA